MTLRPYAGGEVSQSFMLTHQNAQVGACTACLQRFISVTTAVFIASPFGDLLRTRKGFTEGVTTCGILWASRRQVPLFANLRCAICDTVENSGFPKRPKSPYTRCAGRRPYANLIGGAKLCECLSSIEDIPHRRWSAKLKLKLLLELLSEVFEIGTITLKVKKSMSPMGEIASINLPDSIDCAIHLRFYRRKIKLNNLGNFWRKSCFL